jgi:L-seryl-tRNA(Ser) seleniumtransferase
LNPNDILRQLPSVDEVLQQLDVRCPRELVVAETRRAITQARERLKRGEPADIGRLPEQILSELQRLMRPSLRRVINATGVVLHTNLGRAPLPRFEPPSGYSNLEYDLAEGARGKRDAHVGPLLERLLGAPAIVVNNNAAAVFLVLLELASGGEAIVSRGELIEIGDGFRIPEIMTQSGALLREVGTTNRTRLEDYANAVGERTRLVMRVHPSNFRIAGFTAKPELHELAALCRDRGLPLYEDLGSGSLVDLSGYGVEEPTADASLKAGVDVVSFSGDKLLGGPQCGIIAGRADLISRLRRNPMFRALRVDKLILAALETTLRHLLMCRWEQVPALRIIALPAEQIRDRTEAFLRRNPAVGGSVIRGQSLIGGGSTPQQVLPTYLLALAGADPVRLEARLRAGDPPVIARIEDDRVVLDFRTVADEEEEQLAAALAEAVA